MWTYIAAQGANGPTGLLEVLNGYGLAGLGVVAALLLLYANSKAWIAVWEKTVKPVVEARERDSESFLQGTRNNAQAAQYIAQAASSMERANASTEKTAQHLENSIDRVLAFEKEARHDRHGA